MAQKCSQPTTPQPRPLVPWLVKKRDLQRYLGRALTACNRGRVIYVFHVIKETKMLCALVRFEDYRPLLLAAHADLVKGRFREVSLETLPR
jgi:hypothetical protein